MSTLEGTLERITFHSESDGYTVARLIPRGKTYLVTVVGKLLGVKVGETLELQGRWVNHAQHGRQFEVTGFRTILPATVEGIRRYLGSGLIKGIGPVTARRIAETFGKYTLEVIDHQPERLNEVPGLGPKRVALITQAWREQQQIKEIMIFLQELGLTPGLAVRIYKQYRESSLSVVRMQPYRLADEVYGIGFLTADRIARAQGVALDDPQRIGAGLRYTLSKAADDGHCYLPATELITRAAALLGVDVAQAEAALHDPLIAGEIEIVPLTAMQRPLRPVMPDTPPLAAVDPSPAVYLAPFARAEQGIAANITRLQHAPSLIAPFYRRANWVRVFAHLTARHNISLTTRQQAAVQMALTSTVSLLTGGPGTGKTTTLRTVITLLQARGYRAALCSPTGRAARRLAETTGTEACTIHRLLEFSPQNGPHFKRNADYPLECDLLIVDEASMLDVLLANHLLKAIPCGAHVLLVGDTDQLPSVGPGRVLRDLLESMAVPSVHLDTIFRQAEGSGIITNAHRINSGELPHYRGLHDFFFFSATEPERCAALTIDLVAERIPRRFGFDPHHDIQVLTPTHRGPAGVATLNSLLQEALNPARPGCSAKRFGAVTFRVGDRVMQLRNNYDLDVYNGDIGVVTAIDTVEQLLHVQFESERAVAYDFELLDELTLAYAISVHKSQGGEYPAVVVPLLMQHYTLLQRNLLYTAVTRARELVVLVGDRKAIAIAVGNNNVQQRYTGLGWRLG